MIPKTGYKIRITVVGVTNGKCSQGHKAGDTWLIDRGKTPANLCINAFCQAIFPRLRTLRYGGEHPWDIDKDISYAICPDMNRQVKFEIKRLRN